jgi:exopolysaccharide biosynthesis polyprenyl glycosylphosphotransferase
MSADAVAGRSMPAGSATRLAPVASHTAPWAWRDAWPRAVRKLSRLFAGLPASAWLLIDASLILCWLDLGYKVFPPFILIGTPHVDWWQAAVVFVASLLVSSLIFGLYERETVLSRSRLLTRTLLTAAASTVIAYAIIYVLMYATVSRRVAGFSMTGFVVCGLSVRLLARRVIHRLNRVLLVVGPRALFESFEEARDRGFLSEYHLLGHATTRPNSPDAEQGKGALGWICDYIPKLGEDRVTDVVVGAEAASDARVMDWVVPCLQHGCRVTNEAIFYEKATGQILVDEITPYWFLFADLKVHCEKEATIKRIADLVISTMGLLLTAPLWPIIALAVKIGDGGPVLYSQDRVGQNGRIFKLYKFRTMKQGAENGQSVWASPDDPRVTPFGRILRRTRLDELPQLYNILIGQMSVVGPRPERPDIVESLSSKLPYYAERHLVKPGLTGWAQISFRYGASIEDAKRKLQFDLYYLKHMCLELDIMIVFRTLGTFLRGAC